MTAEDRLEEKAREYLKAEFGVLGSTYQIMAGFALVMVAEEREACAKVAEEHLYYGPGVGDEIADLIRART